MRTLTGTLLLACVTGFCVAADEKPVQPEGAYLLVAMEMKGDGVPADVLAKQPEANRTFTFKGETLTVVKNKKVQTLTIALDASKNPAEITIVGKDANGKDQLSHGIYKSDGEVVMICVVESNNPKDWPTEFKTSKDSKAVLMLLKKK
jgi:uncharacterized protein (TIGR03067 family)